MITLGDYYPELNEIIDVNMQKLPHLAGKELLEVTIDLHDYCRLKAVGGMLIEYDVSIYKKYLNESGLLRIAYLASWNGECNIYSKISQANAFFDFLAIGKIDSVIKIVQAQAKDVCLKFEYEEDYLYVSLLSEILNNSDKNVVDNIIKRAKSLFEGDELIRLNVCIAIINQDSIAFSKTFEELLTLRETELLTQERSMSRNEIDFLSGSNVFIEGLALLSLAQRAGIAIKKRYTYCPAELVAVTG